MATGSYRKDIDGLRCLAVMPVVFNHAGVGGFPGGFVGVDIFFVISGFLITGILTRELEQGKFSLIGFYERRARRILPAISAVVLACLVGGWFVLLPDEYSTLAQSSVATVGFVSNIWFWLSASNYFGAGVAFEPLLHTWSLAVEEQFYVFFPLLLWAFSGISRKWLTGAVALICAASFALSVWGTANSPIATFYLMPTRLWELGLGALLALGAFPSARLRSVGEVGGLLGLALIGGSVVLVNHETPFPGLAALPACAGATLVIWSGTRHHPLTSRILAFTPLVWIGLISYSVYLWHWPILVAARLVQGSIVLPPAIAGACIALSILAAALSWRYIEQPFRRPGSGFKLSRKPVFALSAAAMALLTVFSATLYFMRGAPERLDPQALAFYDEARERDPLDENCMKQAVGAPPCTLGEEPGTRAPDVVIWGDSHAGAMLPAFDGAMRERGLSGWAFTKSACAPLIGVRRADHPASHRCDEHNRLVLDRIGRLPPGTVVIMIGRWALITEGARAAGEQGETAMLARTGGPMVAPEENARLVREGLDAALGELARSGKTVFILEPMPEFGVDVPKSMARNSLTSTQARFLDRAAYARRAARANAILAEVAARNGASVVEPIDLACPERCRTVIEGRALYRDDDHLSLAGAAWFVPRLFEPALQAAGGARGAIATGD